MAQKFVVVGRRNPMDADAPIKFYGLAKSNKKVTLKEICERIAERSSYSKGELEGCITEYLLETLHVLAEGNIAQMGDLGNFRLNVLTATPTDLAADFGTANIGGAKVNFWPGSMLRDLCKTVKFNLERKEESSEKPGEDSGETPKQ